MNFFFYYLEIFKLFNIYILNLMVNKLKKMVDWIFLKKNIYNMFRNIQDMYDRNYVYVYDDLK